MPNLFSFLPVEILAWPPALTSGLMRTDTGATLPIAAATSLSRSSSGSLSRLKHLMPSSSPRRISATVLPTPENTILRAGMPAAMARSSSPPDTTSAPAPSPATTFSTAWLELAFIA